jgi:hypothetical protein
MKVLLVLFLGVCLCRSETNAVTQSSIINDRIDKVNIDMKNTYNLQLKADRSLVLTGYTIQDPLSKLFRTYSVIRVDF